MIYYGIQVIFKSRYQTLYSHFQICFKECEENFFGRTVFAMQLVKAATDQQEYVTLDVFLDGEENFVTTVVHLLMLNAPSDTCI